jgi:predicted phosphodiesterase
VYESIDADLIMYGHYHAHHVLSLGSKLLVNVASIGMSPRETSAYTIVECRNGGFTIQQYQVPYDTAAFRRLCQQRGVPGMSA